MPRKNAVKYEDLLKKDGEVKKGFSAKLVDVKDKTLSQAVDVLKEHVKAVLKDVAEKRGPVEKFVIGKTFARKKQNKAEPFKRMEFDSWNLDGGVNGRWNQSYKKEDFDGLVVICAVTKNVLQRVDQDEEDDEVLYNHHDYALALKQQLVHYFAYEERDKTLGNSSLTTEDGERQKGKAGVLFIAFKLKDEEYLK